MHFPILTTLEKKKNTTDIASTINHTILNSITMIARTNNTWTTPKTYTNGNEKEIHRFLFAFGIFLSVQFYFRGQQV